MPKNDSTDSSNPIIKCVAIGDGGVGKTSLLVTYACGEFPKVYEPTVFENYSTDLEVGGRRYTMSLVDTAGQEDYSNLRHLSYPLTQVFIICFSVVNPTSMENVGHLWLPEIRMFCPEAPFVLVGTQTDLRVDRRALDGLAKTKQTPVSREQGELLAKSVGAFKYVECSSLTGDNMPNVFLEAVGAYLASRQQNRSKPGRKCRLM